MNTVPSYILCAETVEHAQLLVSFSVYLLLLLLFCIILIDCLLFSAITNVFKIGSQLFFWSRSPPPSITMSDAENQFMETSEQNGNEGEEEQNGAEQEELFAVTEGAEGEAEAEAEETQEEAGDGGKINASKGEDDAG